MEETQIQRETRQEGGCLRIPVVSENKGLVLCIANCLIAGRRISVLFMIRFRNDVICLHGKRQKEDGLFHILYRLITILFGIPISRLYLEYNLGSSHISRIPGQNKSN